VVRAGPPDLPAALNNLALVHLDHHGAPPEALKVLAPNLDAPFPQPYARALAARCHARLNDAAEARRQLDAAIGDFESMARGPELVLGGAGGEVVFEYTAVILQAAGDIGDDRRVWTLYQRWQGRHVLPVCEFFAGTAAWNLGRFEQAAQVWARLRHRDWRFLEAYAGVAALCAAGTVPPFRLPYATPRHEDLTAATADAREVKPEEVAARIVADPAKLVMLLYNLFVPEAPMPRAEAKGAPAMITALVAGGRDWGERLARSLFESARIPTPWKIAALEGLCTAGVVRLDEPVTMLIDGESTQVALKQVRLVTEPDPELDARYREALAHRDAGALDEARRILDPLVHGDSIYVPAAVAYANVLRTQGERAEARRMLEMLCGALPGHPVLLFNLAGVCAEDGDYKTARRHLDAIDTDDLPPGLTEKMTALTDRLEPYLLPDYLMERVEEEHRRQVDQRPISPETLTLQRALDEIPVVWLDAACRLHGLRHRAQLRRDRARQLAARMRTEAVEALRALAHLDDDGRARELLRFLLEHGGWARAGAITRKFGTDEGDGYYWEDSPPASPLGRLRLACLVFVGRATRKGKRVRVAAVPADLRQVLREAIDA